MTAESITLPRVRRNLPLWAKIALAVHFPLIVIGVNYFAPNSPFQAPKTVPQQREAISKGLSVSPRAAERILRKEFILAHEKPFDVIAYGSSRALAMDSAAVGTTDFLNAGGSYGTLYDFAALYSLFERTGRFPNKMIVSLDGWMLNINVDTRAWLDYGSDVPRGLDLVGMRNRFDVDLYRFTGSMIRAWHDFTYLISPATFTGNLSDMRHRVKDARSLSGLSPIVITHPINLDTDYWASDLAYWYPCVPLDKVRDSARNWGTDKAKPGERFLEGKFDAIDDDLVELLRRLLIKFKKRGVKLFIFLSPLHPISYSDMTLTPARRNTAKAEAVYRDVGRELNIPVFGAHDPAAVGLTEADFCTDAIHIRPDVMKRVFDNTGLADALRK